MLEIVPQGPAPFAPAEAGLDCQRLPEVAAAMSEISVGSMFGWVSPGLANVDCVYRQSAGRERSVLASEENCPSHPPEPPLSQATT